MHLSQIEELDFSDNYIQHLPPAILDFRNLKVATFVNNPLDDESIALLRSRYKAFRKKDVVLQFTGDQVSKE
jgi:hypothetical protein